MIETLETTNTDSALSGEGLRQFFEHSPQAMFMETADGVIDAANASACRLYGAEPEALVGKLSGEILPPVLRGNQAVSGLRDSVLSKGDRSIDVQVLRLPAKVEGEAGFITVIWTKPQTAVARREPEPEAAGESLPEMEAMERMAGRLAHRFNNILTTFSGYGSLVQKDLDEGIVRSGHVRKIIAAADEARALTGDLLRFSRNETVAAVGPLELNAFVTGCAGEMREIVGDRVKIAFDLKNSPLRISGNREIIDDILMRIARNLADHVTSGGQATVSSALEAGEAVIRVKDDGPGISQDLLSRVFEPFFTTSKNPSALGLGLSVIRSLVRSIGGSVSIVSDQNGDGHGTELTLRFPALKADLAKSDTPALEAFPPLAPLETPAAPAPEPAESSAVEVETPKPSPPVESVPSTEKKAMPKGSETILVVEDEPMVRELVTRSLSYLGYTVIKAEDGQAGFETAMERKDEIDLIFSDIVMPRVSGPEMVHRLRSQGISLRVLFTTGFTENKRILENGEIREGINLLPKPYTTRALAERVRQALDAA